MYQMNYSVLSGAVVSVGLKTFREKYKKRRFQESRFTLDLESRTPASACDTSFWEVEDSVFSSKHQLTFVFL